MRLIGTLSNQIDAQKITAFLQTKGIESRCEPSLEPATGHITYHLWVIDEDQLKEASDHLLRFERSPTDPEFNVPVFVEPLEAVAPELEPVEEEIAPKKPSTPFTFLCLALCVFLFFWSSSQEMNLQQRGFAELPFAMTPIQAELMYDLPPPFEAFQTTFETLPLDQTYDSLPQETKNKIERPTPTPIWQGIYSWMVLKLKNQDTAVLEGPLFVKILQGEFWRLISPCFLHAGFFHILFNMLWLWLLGRAIEEKIGLTKTLALTLITGIGSNTAQYLVSGPLFLGYSGIIMGLAAFVWMRQRQAPWEGYSLNRSTIYFLFLFIGAIFLLSFVSFLLQLFTDTPVSPGIANTAHIVGGLLGAFFGRFKCFVARVVK